MLKAAIGTALVAVFTGPACLLLALGVLMNPAAQAQCLPSSPVVNGTPTTLTATTSDGRSVTLDEAQLTRAATIISVGAGTRGVGRDGIVIALMAALTESSLHLLSNTTAYPGSANYPHDGNGSDHDSLGLFQMRPSTGWGSVGNLMDAEYNAEAFYGGPTGPNRGSPRGLLDLTDWKALPKGAAAQAVEVSAFPDRYAAYQPVAETILDALATTTSSGSCGAEGSSAAGAPGAPAVPLASGFAGALISAAQVQIGKPYVWGGGTYTGPSGRGSDGRGPGFDCSGLVLYAAFQATGGKLRLPHYSGAQMTFGRSVAWEDKQPGDLIFFIEPGASAPHHVAIYVGDGKILQAPRTGQNVRFGTTSEFAGQTMRVRRLTS
ncbi:MAG: C40 family peptidase [Nocardioides sp.]|uniref:C40 family peptidase n=1 Tax=Nocardioides sp. TaxID=35761 RepID=UPI0039E6FB69